MPSSFNAFTRKHPEPTKLVEQWFRDGKITQEEFKEFEDAMSYDTRCSIALGCDSH
jgi:polyhydroxyalkanoate synthesis regulator phasin